MLNFSVAKIKEILQEQFSEADKVLIEALRVLANKDFPGANECLRNFITQKDSSDRNLHHLEIEYKVKIESPKAHPALSGPLAQSYMATQKNRVISQSHSAYLLAHIEKYKLFNQTFSSIVDEKYQVLLNLNIKLSPIYMATIEWIKFGLENLSALSYSIINNISAWLAQNTNHSQQTYWESIKQSIASSLISRSSIYEECTKSIFDIPAYTKTLEHYIKHIDSTSKIESALINQIIMHALVTEPKATRALDSLSSISSVLSSGSISIDKILCHIPKEKNITTKNNSLEMAKLTQAVAEKIFIHTLFYEIKGLKSLIDAMSLEKRKDFGLQQCINMVSQILNENDMVSECKSALDFGINIAVRWLEQFCAGRTDSSCAALQVLAVKFLKLIETFKLLNFEIPKVGDIEGLEVHLRSIGVVQVSKSLQQTVKLKNQIMHCYQENELLKSTPMPRFENLTLNIDKKVIGGSQDKAIGTGFYVNNSSEELFFIKRTTRLHLIADDLAEILSSEICNILGFKQFAQCQPVKSQTTGEIYIASRCESGFKPIFNMDGRFTTRLLPHERKEFLEKLGDDSKKQLLNILLICNLIGDYDPNPGNIGTTINKGIVKIDHGWAFDQILSEFMPTWHNSLNPLRYPARFAPTNAMCDYAVILRDCDMAFFEQLYSTFQKPDLLQEKLVELFINIAEIYIGTRATGSLKDSIEAQDIIVSLCERFGLPYTGKVTFEVLAEKLSAALYTRFHNLYLIAVLNKIQHASVVSNVTSEFKHLEKQVSFILKNNIPYNNLAIIKKLSKNIKEHHNHNELNKILDFMLNVLPPQVSSPCPNPSSNPSSSSSSSSSSSDSTSSFSHNPIPSITSNPSSYQSNAVIEKGTKFYVPNRKRKHTRQADYYRSGKEKEKLNLLPTVSESVDNMQPDQRSKKRKLDNVDHVERREAGQKKSPLKS